MKRVDIILGHNVEYRDLMSRMPILVLESSKGGQLQRGACQRRLKFGNLTG